MLNEAIVCSGIYYYDEANITESALAFRMAVHAPDDYDQHDYAGVKGAYGLEPYVKQILNDDGHHSPIYLVTVRFIRNSARW